MKEILRAEYLWKLNYISLWNEMPLVAFSQKSSYLPHIISQWRLLRAS